MVFTIYSEIFFFSFVPFFWLLCSFDSLWVARIYARRWLNQCVIDSFSLSNFQISRVCAHVFRVFSGCKSYAKCENDRTTYKMACALHQLAHTHTHMKFTTWSWFSQLPSKCYRALASSVYNFRCLSFTRFLLRESAHIIKSIKIRICSFFLFLFLLLIFFCYFASLPCIINFVWFEVQNAKREQENDDDDNNEGKNIRQHLNRTDFFFTVRTVFASHALATRIHRFSRIAIF